MVAPALFLCQDPEALKKDEDEKNHSDEEKKKKEIQKTYPAATNPQQIPGDQ